MVSLNVYQIWGSIARDNMDMIVIGLSIDYVQVKGAWNFNWIGFWNYVVVIYKESMFIIVWLPFTPTDVHTGFELSFRKQLVKINPFSTLVLQQTHVFPLQADVKFKAVEKMTVNLFVCIVFRSVNLKN